MKRIGAAIGCSRRMIEEDGLQERQIAPASCHAAWFIETQSIVCDGREVDCQEKKGDGTRVKAGCARETLVPRDPLVGWFV